MVVASNSVQRVFKNMDNCKIVLNCNFQIRLPEAIMREEF